MVKELVKGGGKVDQQDERGWTPLMIAAYHDHQDIARLLLHYGCDLTLQDCVMNIPVRETRYGQGQDHRNECTAQ